MKARTLLLGILLAALATPSFAKVKLVLMPQRENVRLHFELESGGAALMEEERVVALEDGVNQVEMAWEGLPILPQSILFDPVDGKEALTTLAVSTPPSGQSSLIWWVKADGAGSYRLRITYALAGGVTVERMDYSARANAEEAAIDLTGRARLYNGSGMDQNGVSVELGDTQPSTVSLDRDERRDLLALDAATYPLTKRYISDSAVEGGRVQLMYEWDVPAARGAQLPGKARAFLATAGEQGQLDTFLGESYLGYTPKNETCKLFVGFANNIEVQRELTAASDENVKFTKVKENSGESPERVLWDTKRVWKVTLKNHTDKALTVRVKEHAVGEWSVEGDIQPTSVEDIGTMYFDVEVPANGEKVLQYTVVQRNIEPNEPSI